MALGLLSVDRPDLISSFFRSLAKINRSLNHFGIFIANKEEGVSQLSLRILPMKKKGVIKRPDVHAQGTVMLCLYYYVFVTSSYIFKMFLLAMFGKLTIVLHCLSQAYGLKP